MSVSGGRYRPSLTLVMAIGAMLGLAACGPSPVDPVERGGRWLATPVEVSCDDPPQFSPNEALLAFWIAQTPDPRSVPPVTRLGVIDWASGEVWIPGGLPDDVSLGADTLCWNEVDARVHVRGMPGTNFRDARWYAFDLQDPGDWRADRVPPEHCQVASPQTWEAHRPVTHEPSITRGIEVVHAGEREVTLQRRDGTELARHRTLQPGASGIAITRYTWSPGEQWLAYTVGEGRGSWTAGPNRAYLVPTGGGEPRLLGSGVSRLTWRNDQELIGCGGRPTTRERGLAYWRAVDVAVNER